MNKEEKKKTADILTEKSRWIRIGLLFIRLRPLTLGQIYEMGQYVESIEADGLEFKGRYNYVAKMLSEYNNAPLMQDIFLVTAYRRSWKRKLFRRYILKRLTVRHFQDAMDIITDAYNANFFLTSIIFLRQTKPMTEPNQTIVRGQQSEE